METIYLLYKEFEDTKKLFKNNEKVIKERFALFIYTLNLYQNS